MPPPAGILTTVNQLLDANAYTTGGWSKHDSEDGNPANIGDAWPPEFGLLAGQVAFSIFVLFFWAGSVLGNWCRFAWIQRTITAAEILTATGLTVQPGQYIGIRVRSNVTLRTPNVWFPTTTYGIGIEIEGETTQRLEIYQGLFDLWTIPIDPGNNQVDNYITAQLPLSGPLEITARILALNICPSGNLIATFPEFEYAVFEPEPGPPPEPEPVPPAPLTPCSIRDILAVATHETGYRWRSKTEAAGHLTRYAKQLLSRCMASWYGNEVGDELQVTFGVPTSGGWGSFWGHNWGGGVLNSAAMILDLPLPKLEAIWHVEARRAGQTDFEPVNVVKPDDQNGALDPACMIRDRRLQLLRFATAWHLVYDIVRLKSTAIHETPVTWDITLEPNQHIGPLFCRACELEMSRFLAQQHEDPTQSLAFKRLLDDVTSSLMSQSRSQGWIETSRGSRR